MEEKKFCAELEIIRFEDTDVITASLCAGDECLTECVADCEDVENGCHIHCPGAIPF